MGSDLKTSVQLRSQENTVICNCALCYDDAPVARTTMKGVIYHLCAKHAELPLCIRCEMPSTRGQWCSKCREGVTIPKHFESCTFENFRVNEKNKTAIGASREFLAQAAGLYMFGSAGCGKTHLAAAIYNEAHNTRASAAFIPTVELFHLLRCAVKYDEDADDILRKYDRDVLVLDDLGIERNTEYVIETLYMFIDRRYRNDKHRVVITSNLTLDEVGAKFGDRVASRIAGMCRVVEITDSDNRLKKAA